MLNFFRKTPSQPPHPENRATDKPGASPDRQEATSSDQVVLIVDRMFGERLKELPRITPAWIVDSVKNHEAIAGFGSKRRDDNHRTGITSFRDRPDLSANELAACMIGTIDELYQASDKHPRYSRLTVFGATADNILKEAMTHHGLVLASENGTTLEFTKKV